MNRRLYDLMGIGFLLMFLVGSLLGQSVTDHNSQESSAASPETQTTPPAVTKAHDNAYQIGSDDLLGINVWGEPQLTQQIPVRTDGKISLPLVGEVQASGQTPLQLEHEVTEKLRTYITDPQVTVMVLKINSEKFNILGRVVKPGSYPLSTPLTILDAIAEAGGFQDFAKQKDIYVLRQNASGSETRIPFNYKDVIRGKHPEENIHIEPRDTIVVP